MKVVTYKANRTKPDDNLCVVCRKDISDGTMVLFPDTCFNCVLKEHTKDYVSDDTVNWAIEAKKYKKRKKKR